MKNNIKQIRKIKGVTQKQLAEHLGVSKQVISMWENNPDEKIPENRIKQIAEFMRVDERHIYADHLDLRELHKEAIDTEIKNLWKEYGTTTDADEKSYIYNYIQSIQEEDEIDEHRHAIFEQLDEMLHSPRSFEQVSHFTKIANHQNDFAYDRLIERTLDLLDEDDRTIRKIFDEITEFLRLLQPEKNYKLKDDGVWTPYSKFQLELEELVQKHFVRR